MQRILLTIAPLLVSVAVRVIRWTCRVRIHDDPRRELSAQGIGHIFAAIHANQVAGLVAARRGTCAMVSRSGDGQIVAAALHACGHLPIRGSSGTGRKGGATALQRMIQHVRDGRPAMITVDGPRGPRGMVKQGIGMLSRKGDAAVLPTIAIATRRWILSGTWDRLQIPKPFSTIHIYVAQPMLPRGDEPLSEFAQRLARCLHELETRHDPGEAALQTLKFPAEKKAAAA